MKPIRVGPWGRTVFFTGCVWMLANIARAEIVYRWVPDVGSGGSGYIRFDEAFIEASDDGSNHYVYTDVANFITEFGNPPVLEFSFTFDSGLEIDSVSNFSSTSTIQNELAGTQFEAANGVMDGWTFAYFHYDDVLLPHYYEGTDIDQIFCITLPCPQPGGHVEFSGIGAAEFHSGSFQLLLPGDANGDGWVNGQDYLVWAGNFGEHPGADGDPSDGDFNDDGWVNGLDYLAWAEHFGTHTAAAVPEPAAFVTALFGLAGTVLVSCRVRRRT